MKTKIIYISGNEVFEMADIRAAFEEVRAALGLDSDTILFGVPVDCDNALANVNVAPITDTAITETESVTHEIPITTPEPVTIVSDPATETPQITDTTSTDTPDITDNATDIIAPDPVTPETSETIIPILSVLSVQEDNITESQTHEPPIVTPDIANTETHDIPDTAVISDISIDAQLATPNDTDDAPEQVTIGDMITDDAPMAPMEKTLEQLLESMTPLREDVIHDNTDTAITTEIPTFEENDTDATLAQLASEFVESEDKIPTTPKSESHGKIGKLKNILPFKKAKRDDSGLMGDLFGWAGIAANDDDFSIPGFFTPAKKQGA